MTLIATPNARNTDPESSHLVGEDVTKSGRRQRQIDLVTQLVSATPGRTSAELAYIHDQDRYMVARRLSDASGVKKDVMRKCDISGRKAVTWLPL